MRSGVIHAKHATVPFYRLRHVSDRLRNSNIYGTYMCYYTKSDINELFSKQLPFLKKMGYKVDSDNLHIIGLSNGGSAVNIAYNSFSKKFKTITFISTGIYQTYPISSKVLLIGGGKDHSSGSLPGAYRKLKSNGTKTDLFWDNEETHFLMVNRSKDVMDFINKEIQ